MPGGIVTDEFIVRSKEPWVKVPNATVTELAFEKFKQNPNHQFYVQYETGESLTGADLIDKSKRLATILIERYGATQNDMASFYSGNLLEFLVAQFGVLAIGMPFSPITINCKPIEINRQLDDCKATFIFTSKRNAHIIEEVYRQRKEQIKAVIVLDGEHEGFTSLASLLKQADHIDPLLEIKVPLVDLDPKKAIYSIIYTSGSTGLPKGAAASHYAYVYNTLQTNTAPELDWANESLIFCGNMPFAHASGVILNITSIFSLSTMVLIEMPSNDTILDCIHKYKCQWLFMNALLGQYMLTQEAESHDLSSLRNVFVGGAPFPAKLAEALMQKYGFRFREAFGATEMLMISMQRMGEKWESGNLGAPVPGILVKVVDHNTGKTCRPREQGEILLYGESRILCYINRPDADKSAFTKDGWYRTGDIGYVTEGGDIFLVDRIKQMIKYLGYAVYPVECESILYMHKDVKVCVVVPFPHPVYGELPRAYVVLKEGATVTEHELEQFVAERIADQKRLRGGIRFVDDIPMISIGKPNRQYFKEMAAKESAMVYKSSPGKKEIQGKQVTAAKVAAVNAKDINGNLTL